MDHISQKVIQGHCLLQNKISDEVQGHRGGQCCLVWDSLLALQLRRLSLRLQAHLVTELGPACWSPVLLLSLPLSAQKQKRLGEDHGHLRHKVIMQSRSQETWVHVLFVTLGKVTLFCLSLY